MDSLVNIKPHIIIQARLGSTRLPEKVMRKINGQPMIGLQIERLKKTNFPIILATSIASENDGLAEYAESLDVKVFRGSEENVLDRYYQAAKNFGAKHIIRITGDNPLVDPFFITKQLKSLKIDEQRYYLFDGSNKKLPIGMAFEMFPFSLLEEACNKANSIYEKEHVTPYMHQNSPGNIVTYNFNNIKDHYKFRLTVDTESDFKLMQELIVNFKSQNKSLEEIIKILDENPRLIKINQSVYQKKWNE
jgi:spore coat polysaccharide biosynthesis protein SpsF (cytidylyltransferase family)